jgi:hypothetical protein
MKLKY